MPLGMLARGQGLAFDQGETVALRVLRGIRAGGAAQGHVRASVKDGVSDQREACRKADL